MYYCLDLTHWFVASDSSFPSIIGTNLLTLAVLPRPMQSAPQARLVAELHESQTQAFYHRSV